MIIYLLHFHRPLHHARHYLGIATDLGARLEEHARGTGARIMAVLKERGIGWTLARTWCGTRKDEKQLKRRRDMPRVCPLCHGAKPGHLADPRKRTWRKPGKPTEAV